MHSLEAKRVLFHQGADHCTRILTICPIEYCQGNKKDYIETNDCHRVRALDFAIRFGLSLILTYSFRDS